MLLRTSSTPIFSPFVKSKGLNLEVDGSRNTLTFGHCYSFSSTCHEAVNIDGVSLLTSEEWNFEKYLVPWPKIRKVPSENDLQIISSRSISSAKSAANEVSYSTNDTSINGVHENRSRHKRQWSRRMALRRYSSLPASFSACKDNISTLDSQFTFQDYVRMPMPQLKELQWAGDDEGDGEVEDSEYVDDSAREINGPYPDLGCCVTEPTDGCFKSRNLVAYCNDSKVSLHENYSPKSVLKVGTLHNSSKGVSSDFPGDSDEQDPISGIQGESSFVIDGERYTTISRAASGVAVACNSRGCIPLNTSETLGPMFIAGGLGVGAKGNPGIFHYNRCGDFESKMRKAEENYVKILDVNPGHPLLLSNYARFLYEVRQDYTKAEEYFERAILAGPGDGELLAQYAKLIWQVYRDEARAGSYFEQAVQAASDNCFVLTAYASFLWESEDAE